MFKKILLSAGALALLSACASTGTSGSKTTSAPIGKDARIFADYLIGSYANEVEDAENRASFYGRAYEGDQSDSALARKAVTAAWMAGDIEGAKSLARDILDEHPEEPMARAILGGMAFAEGRYSTAERYFDIQSPDPSIQILIDVMGAWTQDALGNPESGTALLDDLSGWAYIKVLGQIQRANLLGTDGDLDTSYTIFDLADSAGVATIEVALSRARLMSEAGNDDDALAFITKFDDANGGFESGPVRVYLDDLKDDNVLSQRLTPQQEASWAMNEAAAGFFIQNRAYDVAEVFLRTATSIDPTNDKSKIWLASLIKNEREDEALRLFQAVSSDSPYAMSARLSEADLFFDRNEDTKAIAILEQANRDFANITTRGALGRARLFRENYKDALPIYDALVSSMSEEELENNFEPLYYRAVSYEREGQWENAVADFKRVLEIDPEDANTLNYLGYTWVDRGENLEEAFDMIEKAVELEPESGAIVDSLGWAHYKLGRYSEAKDNLEKAVELTPNSATIVDHLGDVYWKLGRFREAGYQWQRALEFDPTDKERKNIEAKLKGGLSAATSD